MSDPAQLRALASSIRDAGERVRLVATRVAAVAGVPWRSLTADAFRERVDDCAAHLRRTAGLLDDAAALTQAHAAALEHAVAELADTAPQALDVVNGDQR